jgi:hypothetical protein
LVEEGNEAERAIALNPNDSGNYNELGWALLWSGKIDAAIATRFVFLH